MGARIRAVLFDFGNTLFAHASLTDTILAAAARLRLGIDAATAAGLAGRIDALAASPAEARFGRDLDPVVWAARWAVIYAVADDEHPGLGAAIDESMHDPLAWVPYARTRTVLGELRARDLRVGVVSNTGWDVRGAFAVRELDAAVDTFTLSCEVGAAKPSPAIFTAACDALGVEPQQTLMVGDDARADVGGVALGMRTLLLPPGPPGADNGIGDVLGLLASANGSPGDPTADPTDDPTAGDTADGTDRGSTATIGASAPADGATR